MMKITHDELIMCSACGELYAPNFDNANTVVLFINRGKLLNALCEDCLAKDKDNAKSVIESLMDAAYSR